MSVMAHLLTLAILATSPAPTSGSPPPSLDGLAWMAGHWVAASPSGASSEEFWLAPKGGLMVGGNRGVSPTGRASFEYLRIEERDDGIVYVASPGGAPPTEFRLTAATGTTATFENPTHDFPRRIAYRLEGDSLVARIDGGAEAEGQGMELRWSRK